MASTRTFTTPRSLTIVAAILVAAISFLAFAISFAALSDLAARSGIPRQIAWAWPLIVDGSIVTAMLVIFAWRGQGRRQTTWPWITLCFFAVVSIVGNGVHTVAVLDVRQGVSVEFAIFVGALPPIGLLLSSEMLVRLLAGRTTATTDAVTLAPEPEPEPRQPLSADDAAPAAATRPISAMPNHVPVYAACCAGGRASRRRHRCDDVCDTTRCHGQRAQRHERDRPRCRRDTARGHERDNPGIYW